MKDRNNQFCISGDVDWKLTQLPYTTYNGDATTGFALFRLSYESEQLVKWQSIFNLKKFYSNTMDYTIDSFKMGFKYEIYNWPFHQAWCMNFATYAQPITVKITAKNLFTKCAKTLVNCFDDWD